jgi:tRNA pseudouridine55 synthase
MKTRADYFNKVNILEVDDFGRPSGVLLIDKPANISSHDVVDRVRRILNIRQVGHGGALDVFATGIEIILVGKATKLSDELLGLDKAYEATILFGVSTTTQDIEGEITNQIQEEIDLKKEKIEDVLSGFKGEQEQFVSPFSSVKVNGKKLRKVLRESTYSYEITNNDLGERYIELTHKIDNKLNYKIQIPKKKITIFNIKALEQGVLNEAETLIPGLKLNFTLPYCKIYVKCSKGTYIRQLAEDIGAKFGLPAVLIKLDRVEIDKWTKENTLSYETLDKTLLKGE